MSRAEREAWQAMLEADPALRAAWEDYRRILAAAADQFKAGDDPDLEAVRRAADKVMTEGGGDCIIQ